LLFLNVTSSAGIAGIIIGLHVIELATQVILTRNYARKSLNEICYLESFVLPFKTSLWPLDVICDIAIPPNAFSPPKFTASAATTFLLSIVAVLVARLIVLYLWCFAICIIVAPVILFFDVLLSCVQRTLQRIGHREPHASATNSASDVTSSTQRVYVCLPVFSTDCS